MEASSGTPLAVASGSAATPEGDLGTILDCAVCWEGYDSDAHCPRQLMCGHSLCDACIRELPWSTLRGVELPFVITCPWCMCWSPRLFWERALKYPSKNFSLMWMVESYRTKNPQTPRSARRATFPSLQASDGSCEERQRRLVLLPRGALREREGALARALRDARLAGALARAAAGWLAKKFSLLVVAAILCMMLLVQIGMLPVGVIVVVSTMVVLIFVGFVMTSMTLLIVLPAAILFEIAGSVLRLLIN